VQKAAFPKHGTAPRFYDTFFHVASHCDLSIPAFLHD
jgi:hypothetical protein